MAYPTSDDILATLPSGAPSTLKTEIDVSIGEWKARIADAAGLKEAPEGDPLAEAIVRRGAVGDAMKQIMLSDFRSETPAADAMIRQAEAMLARYDATHSTPDEEEAGAPTVFIRKALW